MLIEAILLWVAVLIFVSVISSKLSDKFAIPILLLFLAIGILAGSEGIGKIYFNNAQLAKSIGIIALIFIIFSGGLDTNWKETKTVIWQGVALSTAGVLITAVITGYFAIYILKFSFFEGMLLGSIVSSTDAAAVFNILRSKRISLRKPLKQLLEFESGSNDPMAVFLTVSFISFLTVKNMNFSALVFRFILDMGIGMLMGYLMAKFITILINRLKLEYEGLYLALMISLVLLSYAIAVLLKGNGFLAVYLVGLILGQAELPYKKMIVRFHDGLAWLMQITMFVTLGLLVSPSHIVPLVGVGLLLTLILMLIARPASVLLCLLPFKMNIQKKAMVAWVGLRGAVPIILATFPFMAGIAQADTIFNIVFFVVISSVFIQGTSIPILSRILKLDAPLTNKTNYPIEFEKTAAIDAELIEVIVPYDSEIVGKKISDLGIPQKCLIVLVSRQGKFIIPSGSMIIEEGDVLLVLANSKDFSVFQQTLTRLKKKQ
ncbi:MAG: potassium/proton antiporter [Candidatus Omnitrophica bacterium]|nr:potassium/proton antiporter [Candidatus Omnitrophota bacterium]